jgi:hypothetical protein
MRYYDINDPPLDVQISILKGEIIKWKMFASKHSSDAKIQELSKDAIDNRVRKIRLLEMEN